MGGTALGAALSYRVILETVIRRFATQLWWVKVSDQKLGMCLLPVLRVKNIWGYLWSFFHILAAP